jgi:hypothetical protein
LSLLLDIRRSAQDAGMNLVGAVPAPTFDATQPCGRRVEEFLPGCGTVLVLGSGGKEFWSRLCDQVRVEEPKPSPSHHPVNAYTASIAGNILDELGAQGCRGRAVYPDDRRSLNFLQLAESAGFGTVSPVIGLLLHPDFGPWVSLRAALLLQGEPFGSLDDRSLGDSFSPCVDCARPCVQACPVGVHDGRGGADLRACASHRHRGNCAGGCDVRRACPVGAQHRYDSAEERFRHAYSLFAMRRHFGLGLWKLVPTSLR